MVHAGLVAVFLGEGGGGGLYLSRKNVFDLRTFLLGEVDLLELSSPFPL